MSTQLQHPPVVPPIVIERYAGRTVIWLHGEHDLSNADGLTAVIERTACASGDNLVFDLSGVTFMSAATLRAVCGSRTLGARPCRSVTLRAPSRCAQRMIDLCGLASMLEGASGGGVLA